MEGWHKMKKQRIMTITYPHDETKINRLQTCLKMCAIRFVIIDDVINYKIYIDKNKCTWQQVMQEVNRVHAVKFRFRNDMYIKNGLVYVEC